MLWLALRHRARICRPIFHETKLEAALVARFAGYGKQLRGGRLGRLLPTSGRRDGGVPSLC